ncbi:hypothetical protein Bbelb_035170 [Branchiostoma belcheri]|nr:hypothetical protein Bbelb_035170 [Branchiostoma belcheri]
MNKGKAVGLWKGQTVVRRILRGEGRQLRVPVPGDDSGDDVIVQEASKKMRAQQIYTEDDDLLLVNRQAISSVKKDPRVTIIGRRLVLVVVTMTTVTSVSDLNANSAPGPIASTSQDRRPGPGPVHVQPDLSRDYEFADYVSVGVVFAMSIVHRGPAPNGLHPGIAQAVCGRDLEHLNAEEPKEPRLAQFLQKLDNAGENLSDILQDEEAMNIMETIHNIRRCLGTFGLIDAFDKNPSLLEELLNLKNEKVTDDEASQMFMMKYAENGSNRKAVQVSLVEKLCTWLEDVEEDEG